MLIQPGKCLLVEVPISTHPTSVSQVQVLKSRGAVHGKKARILSLHSLSPGQRQGAQLLQPAITCRDRTLEHKFSPIPNLPLVPEDIFSRCMHYVLLPTLTAPSLLSYIWGGPSGKWHTAILPPSMHARARCVC